MARMAARTRRDRAREDWWIEGLVVQTKSRLSDLGMALAVRTADSRAANTASMRCFECETVFWRVASDGADVTDLFLFLGIAGGFSECELNCGAERFGRSSAVRKKAENLGKETLFTCGKIPPPPSPK